MAEHPILFSTEMVKAILDGRKTQTRRVIVGKTTKEPIPLNISPDEFMKHCPCPYGQPGDRLIIRSTWAVLPEWDNHKPSDIPPNEVGIWFWLAGTREKPEGAGKSRPGRFLPKTLWHYLPRLEVTGVRVERVQSITSDDAINEGIETDIWDMAIVARKYDTADEWFQMWSDDDGYENYSSIETIYRDSFRSLWDSINAKRGYSWDSNPWVWVVEFKVV